ncbi:MAG: amidase [Serratia proteamaculans]
MMKLSEYVSYDALGLAELVQGGEVSAQELQQTAQAAVEAVNPAINAVVEHWTPPPPEGEGPLSGVPFLIKDIAISMAGKRQELGSRLAQGHIAATDSYLMSNIRRAGLVTFGRTTTPEMAFSTTTEAVLYGATRNPWNPDFSAGGSSGGAGAAVAAGIVPIAHATDAAGSIRVPASSNGLFGLKPTRGRVSHGPAMDEVFNGFGVQLGLSRTVRDSAALLDALQHPHPGEPYYTTPPAQTWLSQVTSEPGRLRIGMMTQAWNGGKTDPHIAQATADTAVLLSELGHQVSEADMAIGASWQELVFANAQIWCANLVGWVDGLSQATGRPISTETLEPETLACYRYGLAARAVDMVAALDVRNRVTRAVAAYFQQYDLLLTPTLPDLPWRIGRYGTGTADMSGLEWTAHLFDHSPFTPVFNVAGVPAMSVPLAQDPQHNLPIGMQFVAGFGREDLLLQLAGQLERAAPWQQRRPAIWAGSASR